MKYADPDSLVFQLAGVVEKILPMRTVIRTDAKVPVYINNKVFTDLNQSTN